MCMTPLEIRFILFEMLTNNVQLNSVQIVEQRPITSIIEESREKERPISSFSQKRVVKNYKHNSVPFQEKAISHLVGKPRVSSWIIFTILFIKIFN